MTSIKGIDVASWQHDTEQPINWEKVKASGVRFAIIKATQGNAYTNPWLKRDLNGAREAGILVGAYHFFEYGTEATEQARWFIDSISGELLGLGAWIDWEPGTMPDYQVSSDYNALVAEIGTARRPVGLYCDESWLERFRTLNLEVHRLWLAAPSLTEAPAGAFIWQTGSMTVDGVAGEVDVDKLLSIRGINLPPAAVAPKPPAPLHPLEPAREQLAEQPPAGSETSAERHAQEVADAPLRAELRG